jgi:urea transport system ATP-binding protein
VKLDIEGVEVSYGRTRVLFGVDLTIPDGELVCLMGRNGVGKTTLLRAIMGLLPLERGTVAADGNDLGRTPPFQRALSGIGYVPQGHQVFPHLSTRQNLEVVAGRSGKFDPIVIDEVLTVFPALKGLLDRPAGLLSGGQAQQLAIATVLTTRPRLLILDEPTEGIQPSIIMEIEDVIAGLHQSTGMSILLVEQYVEFALRLADRYAVMEGGVIVAAGDTESADAASFTELLGV